MDSANGANSYEELRKQRLEENKKRLQELNLTGLANSLSQSCKTGSRTPQRHSHLRKPNGGGGGGGSVRRSSRVANLPPADYREASFEIPHLRRSYGRRSLFSRIYASDKARQEAIERAYEIESDLGSAYQTFVKPMLQSHVSGGFWLGLPSGFCKTHMPNRDTWMVLEDENGEDFESLYLAGKVGLSAGWRGFSIDHDLTDGDCLVFQLIPPNRFKVYIVRVAAYESGNTSEKVFQNEADAGTEPMKTGKRKRSSAEADVDGSKKRQKIVQNVEVKADIIELSENGSADAKDKKVTNENEHNSKAKKGSGKRTIETTEGAKSKTIHGQKETIKRINSLMPSRKSRRLDAHIKTSEGVVNELMQELNLAGLANSLSQTCKTGSRTPQRHSHQRKSSGGGGGDGSVRRSSRVANLPPADYREASFEIPHLRRRRSLFSRIYASDKARQEAIERAYEIESDLGSAYQTFVKPMLQSHVSGGFWLGLPSGFCKTYMPNRDTWMVLEDESGEDFESLYLACKVGLSAGWRGFSIDHDLTDGDCLVFQLIPPYRFKIYIVRATAYESGNTLEKDFQNEADAGTEPMKTGKRKRSSAEADVDGSKKRQKIVQKVEVKADIIEFYENGSADAKDKKVTNENEHNSKAKKGSGKRTIETTAGVKSKTIHGQKETIKRINSLMPSRRLDAHIKTSEVLELKVSVRVTY